ncbi:hypothetical protein IAQ61_001740, partial [Plenodomus lingam]|uniref:uncharacterized protein n=1 Tax=Leptosphaeria maculans TaxID=5022 RepID=UPI0033305A23
QKMKIASVAVQVGDDGFVSSSGTVQVCHWSQENPSRRPFLAQTKFAVRDLQVLFVDKWKRVGLQSEQHYSRPYMACCQIVPSRSGLVRVVAVRALHIVRASSSILFAQHHLRHLVIDNTFGPTIFNIFTCARAFHTYTDGPNNVEGFSFRDDDATRLRGSDRLGVLSNLGHQVSFTVCNDRKSRLVTKLMEERLYSPYAEPSFEITPANASLVYISHFTKDNINFAYCIRGSHMTKFLIGTFGMQAYDGPALITPVVLFSQENLLKGVTLLGYQSNSQLRVNKNNTQTEKVRWRYLYETARIQWAKLKFDMTRWIDLKDEIQEALKSKQLLGLAPESDEEMHEDANENDADSDGEPGVSSVTSRQIQKSPETADRGMTRPGGLEEAGRDDESIPDRTLGDVETDSSESAGLDINILSLLHSIIESGGKPDDLYAYLAKRDTHGNIVGDQELRDKVVALVDTISLIIDYNQQVRDNEAMGRETSDIAKEELMNFYRIRDELVEDIHEIRMLPEDTKDDFSGSSSDKMRPPWVLSEDEKVTMGVMVAMAIEQPPRIALRLLQDNHWDVDEAIESWFDVPEDQMYYLEDGEIIGGHNSLNAPRMRETHLASVASSSGLKNLKESTPEDLAADRARLERLIAQENGTPNAQQPRQQQRLEQQDTNPCGIPNMVKKSPTLKLWQKPQDPTPDTSSPPIQPANSLGAMHKEMIDAFASTSTFSDCIPTPPESTKRPVSQDFHNLAADALASMGKKRMLEVSCAKQWQQEGEEDEDEEGDEEEDEEEEIIDPEKGLALLEQAVNINESNLGKRLSAMAKAGLNQAEAMRRDSAMDAGTMDAGESAIQTGTGRDRNVSAEARKRIEQRQDEEEEGKRKDEE